MFLHVGFDNFVASERIVSIVGVKSAPVKQAINEARKQGMVIDVTCGRRTESAIFTDSGHIILSSRRTETLIGRLNAKSEEDTWPSC